MEKRKTIVIHQENVAPIYLEDEDDRSKEEYSEALSFMTLTNISILHTSTASLITRPSKICSITVHEENVYKDFVEATPDESHQMLVKPKEEKQKEPVDIITDVD